MIKFLVKAFIKNSEDTGNPEVREAYGKFAGAVGIVTNLFLALSKMLTGFVFNSVAIMADGINNLSDAGSSIVTLVGFKLSGIPSDEEHPFGHARYEYISGLVVSLIVIALGVQLVQQSVGKIFNPDPLEFSIVTVVVLSVAIAVKVWQSYFYIVIGKKITSTTLKATATDSKNDVIATSAVLISIFIGKWTGLQLDGIMGAVVGLFIVYSGICLVKETSSTLLGLAPNKKLFDKIEEMVLSYDGILGIHDLVVHEYGAGKTFSTVHVEVPSEANFMECHDLVDNIEREVGKELGIHFVIHLDPINITDEFTVKLKDMVSEHLRDINEELNLHDFRVVIGPTHTNLIFDVLCPQKFPMKDEELKRAIERKTKEIDENYYVVVTIDRMYVMS